MKDWETTAEVPWESQIANIETITIEGVSTVGKNAFNGCEKITSITFPDSVQTIGQNAFTGCKLLNDIKWGGVKTVGESAFSGCVGLVSVTMPSMVDIQSKAFSCLRKDRSC